MKKLSFLIAVILAPANLPGYSKESQPNGKVKLNKAFTIPEASMSKDEVAQILAQAGFPHHVVPLVTCLAEYESRFVSNAVNLNANATRDYGLLQINEIWLKGCKTTATNLTNPFENAKCAYKIYKTQGLTAWSTYKTYKATCLAYKVDGFNGEDLIADTTTSSTIEKLM